MRANASGCVLIAALVALAGCAPQDVVAASRPRDIVGCLFSKRVCDETEWCYDDYAFGRCLPVQGPVPKEALYRYDLMRPALHVLQREMERLFRLGYRWSHAYTQCVLQALLEDVRSGDGRFDRSLCDPLADQDLEAALKVIEGDEQEQLDQRNLAYVQFTPSASNPHAEFADEVYFPPLEEDMDVNVVEVEQAGDSAGAPFGPLGQTRLQPRPGPEPDAPPDATPRRARRRPANSEPHLFASRYNTPDGFRKGHETRDEGDSPRAHQPPAVLDVVLPEGMLLQRAYETVLEQALLREAEKEQMGRNASTRDDEEMVEEAVQGGGGGGEGGGGEGGGGGEEEEAQDLLVKPLESLEEVQRRTPEVFQAQQQPPPPPPPQEPAQTLPAEVRHAAQLLLDAANHQRAPGHTAGGYTEGGLVAVPEQRRRGAAVLSDPNDPVLAATELDDGLDKLLDEYDALEWGFKRPERLDVKKPGPPFSTNNYAFRDKEGSSENLANGGQQEEVILQEQHQHHGQESKEPSNESGPESQQKAESEESTRPSSPEKGSGKAVHNAPHMRPQKKELAQPAAPAARYATEDEYDTVDTSYVYIGFKDRPLLACCSSIHSWQYGTRIVNEVARLLGVEPGAFTNPRVDNNEVAFRVDNNSKGLNASDVAKQIDKIKGQLLRKLGVEVTSAGVGNKTKLPSVLAAPDSNSNLNVAIILTCAALGALLVVLAMSVVVRRHAHSQQKLQNLTAPDSEASKDYQELCRARMANKAAQEKPEPIHVGQRIASLSRESEGSNNSPSSRSSTSSWSEEPALTNMDISTGHMVLSYMEDHLKNKDRLEQEWVALCAYEAEPCASTIASKPENTRKNRHNEFLPYDHSRVVLNDLANISGSDYINASTITDHDPRNPAYIATQGPLPQTAPDFWQMVWEQGSVVMVMLTRLTEAGVAMCHRYWPEEGSELYHIYEVHLVSEHIWCDDYLVRSFYLKNLKTGETRTVTQFHFLSWPDASVPSSTKALLEFRRKVNKSYRGRSCPIVVHCSDGVGRTGTYCLIDMVLNRMAKGAKEIDIAATLEHIRDQRPSMVRTKQQFEFCLMAVAEEVHAILKALPTQQQGISHPHTSEKSAEKRQEKIPEKQGSKQDKETEKQPEKKLTIQSEKQPEKKAGQAAAVTSQKKQESKISEEKQEKEQVQSDK